MPFGLIPYFQVPVVELGPVVIDSWATLVALGFILGLEVARWRGLQRGLEVRDVVDGIVVVVGMGFIVGHIVHVVAYNPHQLEEDGIMAILRVWAGFSSTGGFIGAVLGGVLFYGLIRKRDFWSHADAIMFGFPFGWFLGRMGCFSAHDHIGSRSDFFLAVDFPVARYGGPRHDLGLYEALWTLGIAVVFFLLRDRRVKDGFFIGLFCVLYAPIRFLLDFLRNTDLEGRADLRYAGLTPAQYGMVAMFFAGLWVVWRLRSAEPPPSLQAAGAGESSAPPGAPAPPATPPPDGRSSGP